MQEELLDVVIVGAGLAGLACAARLRALGVDRFRVLERGEGVGGSWRRHYDCLVMNSPYHDLPDDAGLRAQWGMFLRRDELVRYLEAYAELHELSERTRFGISVESVERGAGEWNIGTTARPYRSRFLVLATALSRLPRVPAIPGRDDFAGTCMHSAEYRNPEAFRGRRVLVVGSGNSAGDIALDLVAGGARSVAMWIRSPRHVLSRAAFTRGATMARRMGVAFTAKSLEAGHRYTSTHPEWKERIAELDAFLTRFSVDLSEYGIQRPEVGPATQVHLESREPWYDAGAVDEIRAGRIEVIDGSAAPIESFTRDGVRFGTGERSFDAVIFATGFEPGLQAFVKDAESLLTWDDRRGCLIPKTDGRCRSTVEPSVFFPGFDATPYAGMSLGLWGAEAADAIARELAQPDGGAAES